MVNKKVGENVSTHISLEGDVKQFQGEFHRACLSMNDEIAIYICEWVNDIPLTDIFVGKYSMQMILAIWKSTQFLRALEMMKELLEGLTEKVEFVI